MTSRYLIGLGSNRRHGRFGRPENVLRGALAAMRARGLAVEQVSGVLATRPHGPSRRRFANAAAILATKLDPDALLAELKAIERAFGRRRGQQWSARVLDLDIILWSQGAWSSTGLTVPHIAFRSREFVLKPALDIAAGWRDPLTGRTVRQLARRYDKS